MLNQIDQSVMKDRNNYINNIIFTLKVSSNFWKVWKEFEVQHGNEDTMREMLRIKRSVQAMYNTQVNMMSAQMLNNVSNQVSGVQIDSMRALDNKISGKCFNNCNKIIIIIIITI